MVALDKANHLRINTRLTVMAFNKHLTEAFPVQFVCEGKLELSTAGTGPLWQKCGKVEIGRSCEAPA